MTAAYKPGSWCSTIENITSDPYVRSLAGLSGLYMVGQWTANATGFVTAALCGRQLIELLCKHDRKVFVTSA